MTPSDASMPSADALTTHSGRPMMGDRSGNPTPVRLKTKAMPEEHAIRVYRVTGRVQGVGYRWWTRREAESLGLRGTVRNCEDGSVEVVASGAAGALDHLRRILEQGPPGARVAAVTEEPVTGAAVRIPAGFEILR